MDSTLPSHLALSQKTDDYGEVFLGVWIYFNLISNTILLPILVLTILASNQLQRHSTFINTCLTWIVSGVFSLLLFYTHEYKEEPPKALCIAQASLIYGVIPMWAVAVCALFYYVYQCLQGRGQEAEFGTVASWLMFVAPYLCHITFFTAALVTSLRYPELVSRRLSFFYCHLHYRPLAVIRTVFVSLCSACVIIIEFLLWRKIYRNHSSTRGIQTMNQNESLHSLIRIGIFGVYLIFGAAVDLLAVTDSKTVLPQMYVATAGTVVFFVFGTQTDVLRVWFPFMFRRKPKKVLSRPFRGSGPSTPCQDPPWCLCPDHTTHPGTPGSTIRAHRPSSENLSFSLDDLFPKSPTPARTAPVSFPYIQYAI